ncbi:MAG: shikimate kinase [Candidatus Methanomethylophilus sp.]|nr:shikimate kinase [Methanomethylophilus sp.]MDD4221622.1 shikimate kinase [Methanomethylophilus sp.]MDD4668581.1 shikimate kinase [Methanomethylophilus sp.]
MTGLGRSHGAITLVNAMPCGLGAAAGVKLFTEAAFTVCGREKEVTIGSDPDEDTKMARVCVAETYQSLGLKEPNGWTLTTESNIPVSRGLKSSSSACNAIISAVLDEEHRTMDETELVRLGVRCARAAKVTVTGSFDDACGCQLGGIVITDNRRDQILGRGDLPAELEVVIHVPPRKIRKTGLPLDRLHALAPQIEPLVRQALTDPWGVMTVNGRLISAVSDVDNSVAEQALAAGALGAGMSGSGPAVAMVFPTGAGARFVRDSGLTDTILTTTRGADE